MTASRSSIGYAVGPIPNDPNDLQRFLGAELQKIASVIRLLAEGHVDMTYAAPDKPRDGDVRLSDGVHWNPVAAGAPRFVGYYSAGWHTLG